MVVNYNSEAQKLRILEIKAIFDPKNSFLSNSIDDRIKIKAEITSFFIRYYMNFIKLRLRLQVATIKKASCAFRGRLGCKVAGAATQNRLQVRLC